MKPTIPRSLLCPTHQEVLLLLTPEVFVYHFLFVGHLNYLDNIFALSRASLSTASLRGFPLCAFTHFHSTIFIRSLSSSICIHSSLFLTSPPDDVFHPFFFQL